jgi:hypothetical protein
MKEIGSQRREDREYLSETGGWRGCEDRMMRKNT